MWVIPVPISIRLTEKRKFYLNLNAYRNANHFTLNNAKVKFAEIVAPRIAHLPVMSQIRLSYYLFAGSKHLLDISNITSIVDKFFCDTLVSNGKIPDDNYTYIVGTANAFGGIDKSDPRVEVIIEPL